MVDYNLSGSSFSYSPRISVLMSVYNAEKYLREAIDSILNQTFADFEFIIVDDGSTDGTAEILDSYCDMRIVRLRNEPNQGLVRSLNRGLQVARGEYVARMDADDISEPERFAKQVQYLDANPEITVLGTSIKIIRDETQTDEIWFQSVSHARLAWQLTWKCSLAHPSVMMRRGKILNLGGYDEQYWCAEDYHLWTRVTNAGERLAVLPEPLLLYRVWSDQVCTRHKIEQEQQTIEIAQKYISGLIGDSASKAQVQWILEVWSGEGAIEEITAPNLLRKACTRFVTLCAQIDRNQIRNETSDKLIYSAENALRLGYKRQARANLIAALRLYPTRAVRPLTFQLFWASL